VVSSTPRADGGPSSETSVPLDAPEPALPLAAPLALFGLEFSLATASLDALEVVARSVTKAKVREWFSEFPGTEEVALLSTCHRVGLVVLARYPEERDRWQNVLPGRRDSWKLREGRDVVRHLFRVAAGRESLAIGEAEVCQQVRSAGSFIESRHPRPVLRELFVGAASVADEVIPFAPAATSIASIAASRLLDLVARPLPHVLVVGSGIVGRQVAECLASSARVTVVFHQKPPEEEFLRVTGARAVPLDRLREELATSDAVVTAAKFGNHGLHAFDLPRDRPLVLVDLGMPRNIDPGVHELPNVRLVDLEELYALSGGSAAKDADDLRVEELAGRFSDRLERLLLAPWIDAYRRAAEEVRRAELAHAGRFLGRLAPDQKVAIDRLTQRLVTRLLALPTERIRSLPPGPEGDLQRRFAVELLRPRPPDP
jgi:glutamyl-tRNA reductase